MTVKPLNNMSYYAVCRTIDNKTIEMYQEITAQLLCGTNPRELATTLYDQWEIMAKTLYDNDQITHKQFALAINRIIHHLELMCESLGVEQLTDYSEW